MNFKDTLPGVFLCVAMFACGHARRICSFIPWRQKLIVAAKRPPRCSSILNQIMCNIFEQESCVLNTPGMPQEKEVPAGNDIETGLVVSPEKFALSPGTKKQYVLSLLRHRKERKPGGYTSRLFLNWKMIHRQVESKIHP